jgi:PPM family protein phosphatase
MSEQVKVPVYAAALTDVGGRRTNEDAVYTCAAVEPETIAQRGYLYVVADGTGGQEGGQTASAMAASIIGERYYDEGIERPGAALKAAVETAHAALHELAQHVTTWANMSTTLVAAVIHEDTLYVAHVGDSRAYLVRNGAAQLLTRDHVWLEDDENYGSLVRWLGGARARVEVDLTTLILQDSDKVLLCSDGVTNVVDSQDIQTYVSTHSPSAAAQSLIDLANRRGTSDNVSAAVIQYGGATPKAEGGNRSKAVWYAAGGLIVVIIAALLIFSGTLGRQDDERSSPIVVPDTTVSADSGVAAATATPAVERFEVAQTNEPIVAATATGTPVAEPVTDEQRRATSTPIPATPTPTPRPTLPPPTATSTSPPPTPTSIFNNQPDPELPSDNNGGGGGDDGGGDDGGSEPER